MHCPSAPRTSSRTTKIRIGTLLQSLLKLSRTRSTPDALHERTRFTSLGDPGIRMIYRRLLMIFVIVLVSELSERALAQTWSDPIRFDSAEGIEFRWRDFFIRSDTVAHFIEWEFANMTDSSATIEYAITS